MGVNPPKLRRWLLRLRLSTVIVLTFVAGVLLWLNMPKVIDPPTSWKLEEGVDVYFYGAKTAQGWPIQFRQLIIPGELADISSSLPHGAISMPSFCFDCVVWLAVLAVVAVICEWLARGKS